MKNLLLSAALISAITSFSQAPLKTGKLQLTLRTTEGGTLNRSGVAYNPEKDMYYSVNAGTTFYPMETYDGKGKLLGAIEQGFDYRGVWWNPNTKQLEGNGFNTYGIWTAATDSKNHANGEGKNVLPNTSGPDVQSCADYNWIDDEILYYHEGKIYVHDRKKNFLKETITITGLPFGIHALNRTGIAYTGVKGMEVGVWDYINRRFYFIDKSNGKYVTFCQLPNSAPSQDYLKMGFENNLLWLYDGVNEWLGYQILQNCEEIEYLKEMTCDSYEAPSGKIYTESGIYSDTVRQIGTCDKISVIDLTVLKDGIDKTIRSNGAQMAVNENNAGYQWYKVIDLAMNEFEAIEGANKQLFEPAESGTYLCEIYKDDCSAISEAVTVEVATVEPIVGVEIEITLYPNPAITIVHVRHPFDDMDVKVFAMNGQQVVPDTKASNDIDVSTLKPGVYIVELNAEGRTWSKMIVKQ